MPALLPAFRTFVHRYTVIPDADWEVISSCFQPRRARAGELLLREGQICRHLMFLEEGLLRYYVRKDDGTEVTKFFTVAPYCFTSQNSFFKQQPAAENIESLEESYYYAATFEDNQRLLETLPSWATFGRKITQEVQFFTEVILEELQTRTAEERYTRLLGEQPELVARLPLKVLASYLAIAPQSLSRIRRKLAGK